jgi:hypothetical protein
MMDGTYRRRFFRSVCRPRSAAAAVAGLAVVADNFRPPPAGAQAAVFGLPVGRGVSLAAGMAGSAAAGWGVYGSVVLAALRACDGDDGRPDEGLDDAAG